MGMIQVLQEKFNEIYEREGEEYRELTDEDAEGVQTSVFNDTGLFLAFSDVKKLFKAFLDGDPDKNRPKRKDKNRPKRKDKNQPCLF